MAVGNRKVQDVSNVLDFLPFRKCRFSWKSTLFTLSPILRESIKKNIENEFPKIRVKVYHKKMAAFSGSHHEEFRA